jgi:hypothetical protein
MLKSGGNGRVVTVTETLRVRVVPPLVPLTSRVLVPSEASAATLIVSLLFDEPFEGGVTEAGLKLQVNALGPLHSRLTALWKPLID